MRDKKGLSDIVVTLLIIVLALVAIGGVWIVVSNVLNANTGQANIGAKCLAITVEAIKVNCSTIVSVNQTCSVKLSKTGSDEITGVNLIFTNTTNGVTSPSAIESTGDVPTIVGRTATVDTLIANTVALNKIEVIPYFVDSSGNVQPCSQRTSFTFAASAA